MKKHGVGIVIAVCALAATCLLSGCMGANANLSAEQTYLNDVQTVVEGIEADLDTFATAVKANDEKMAQQALSKVEGDIAVFDQISVPGTMAEVHALYKQGTAMLQEALSDYAQAFFGGDTAALDAIQARYDEALAILAQADELINTALK